MAKKTEQVVENLSTSKEFQKRAGVMEGRLRLLREWEKSGDDAPVLVEDNIRIMREADEFFDRVERDYGHKENLTRIRRNLGFPDKDPPSAEKKKEQESILESVLKASSQTQIQQQMVA